MHAPNIPHSGPVDLEHLRRFTCGDAALEREILSLFVGHGPQCLAALDAATSPQTWIAAAHSLKGSARAVGATHVANLAAAAEASSPDAAQRDQQLAALRLAVDDVCSFVRDLDDQSEPSAAS